MSDNENKQVGYKKPPKQTQFQKGQSGNPKGRPKKSKNIQTLVQEEMSTIITVKENGITKDLTKAEAIVKGLFTKALNQDEKAIRTLWPILQQLGVEAQDLEKYAEESDLKQSDADILKRFKRSAKEDQES